MKNPFRSIYWSIGKDFTINSSVIGLFVLFFYVILFIFSLSAVFSIVIFIGFMITHHIAILLYIQSILKKNKIQYSFRRYYLNIPNFENYLLILVGFFCIVTLGCIANLYNTEINFMQIWNDVFDTETNSSLNNLNYLTYLCVILILPIFEEIIFRGFLTDISEHFSLKYGLLLNVFCFQYQHVHHIMSGNWLFFTLFPILTLVLYDMYKITKTLHICTLFHITFNIIAFEDSIRTYLSYLSVCHYIILLLFFSAFYFILR